MQVEPPPAVSEDSSAAELVRRRLLKGKRFYLGLPGVPYVSAWRTRSKSPSPEEQTILSNDTTEIDIRDPFPDLDTSQDIYRWAVVYENQRGFVLAFFVFAQSSVSTSLISQSHPSFYPILLSPRITPA